MERGYNLYSTVMAAALTTTSRLQIQAEDRTMEAKGFVVPPGQGRVWEMTAGRSSALKLLGGETGESVMMFEETAPAGTETTYHLHHDSDELAYGRRREKGRWCLCRT